VSYPESLQGPQSSAPFDEKMKKLTLSNITLRDIRQVVDLQETSKVDHPWTRVEAIPLTPNEQRRLEDVRSQLVHTQIHLFNEATIWSRAIYPLLLLAERDTIQAWAGVPLQAQYNTFEVEGVADGALGKSLLGRIEAPYLVILETKRGTEAPNPIFQLYGQLLAAARLNWEQDQKDPQEIFGCYTIADSWTFVRAEVQHMTTDRPTLAIEPSQEFGETTKAGTILKLLKGIVARYVGSLDSNQK
jgi:hypothetical protein